MKTIKEVALEMKLSENTIRLWIKSGRIKVVQFKKKGMIRISDEELERLKKGE